MEENLFAISCLLTFASYLSLFFVAKISSKTILGTPINGENAILIVCSAMIIGVVLPILDTDFDRLSYHLNSLSLGQFLLGFVFTIILILGLLYWTSKNRQKAKVSPFERDQDKVNAIVIVCGGAIAVLYICLFILI